MCWFAHAIFSHSIYYSLSIVARFHDTLKLSHPTTLSISVRPHIPARSHSQGLANFDEAQTPLYALRLFDICSFSTLDSLPTSTFYLPRHGLSTT
jgi:hypothetical protein